MNDVSNSTDGDWWLAKNSRISAKTSMPRISAATPMLLMIASSRTPKTLIERRRSARRQADERLHVEPGTGDGSASSKSG